MTRFLLVTFVALAVAARPARADDPARALENDLRPFLVAMHHAAESGDVVAGDFDRSERDCVAAIERAAKAGVQPTDQLADPTGGDPFLFAHAGDKCADYRTWRLLMHAAQSIDKAAGELHVAQSIDPGEVKGEWATAEGAIGAACVKDVDDAIAAGAPPDRKLVIVRESTTIVDARAKYCQPLIDWAKTFAVETEKVRAEEAAKVKATYTKYHFAGDRLALFVKYDGAAWYVARGGCTEEDDLAALKKARVVFQWLTSEQDGTSTIRRYEFRGDKLVRQSELTFDTRGAASRSCR